jgi:hypothetical protein
MSLVILLSPLGITSIHLIILQAEFYSELQRIPWDNVKVIHEDDLNISEMEDLIMITKADNQVHM